MINPYKIKLIALDVDHTLLNSKSEISEKNRKAVFDVVKEGVHVVIASGRSTPALYQVRKELGLLDENSYTVALNGAVILKGGEVLKEEKMDREDAIFLISELKKIPGISGNICLYNSHDSYLAEIETERLRNYGMRTGIMPVVVKNLQDSAADKVSKILVLSDENTLENAASIMAALVPSRNRNMFFTERHLLEFTTGGATKGRALRVVADMLNINEKHILSMGDNENDISMLEFSRFSFAPSNSSEGAKRAAKITTAESCDESAVAAVIEKYILGH